MTLEIKCICGCGDIEHAFASKWKCNECGRFHGPDALDRMSNAARARGDYHV